MNVGATLDAGTQVAECSQSGGSALNHPAVALETIIALDVSLGDVILDTSVLELSTASRVVVTLVRMQFSGPTQRPASFAARTRQGIDEFLKDHPIVMVDPGDGKDQRDALAVRDEVALAAEFAPILGLGPRVRTLGSQHSGLIHAGRAQIGCR